MNKVSALLCQIFDWHLQLRAKDPSTVIDRSFKEDILSTLFIETSQHFISVSTLGLPPISKSHMSAPAPSPVMPLTFPVSPSCQVSSASSNGTGEATRPSLPFHVLVPASECGHLMATLFLSWCLFCFHRR